MEKNEINKEEKKHNVCFKLIAILEIFIVIVLEIRKG